MKYDKKRFTDKNSIQMNGWALTPIQTRVIKLKNGLFIINFRIDFILLLIETSSFLLSLQGILTVSELPLVTSCVLAAVSRFHFG